MFIEPKVSIADLATSVKRLSDFFIDTPMGKTPWKERYCQQAYHHYFLPLNFLRNQLVIKRGLEVDFFNGLETTVDWGAGPGTASFALNKELNLKNQFLIENSSEAVRIFSDLHREYLKNYEFHIRLNTQDLKINFKRSLLTLSYSFTEMAELPKGWDQFEALMILEPSTREDGRRLLEIRDQLIKAGYTIWAPCTHQESCPLFTQSKQDWCHDRIKVDAPKWFLDLENKLPFKNKTITTSYLLARKDKPKFDFTNKARLVGDSLEEKGKTRQMICRGPNREFLAWIHKNISPEILPRGDLFNLPNPNEIEIKSNELRLKKSD